MALECVVVGSPRLPVVAGKPVPSATIRLVWARSALRTLVALAVIAFASTASSAAFAGTSTTVYSPFSYHGVVGPQVRMVAGSCWENSAVTPRDDAWRCLVGNDIYDPCFSSAFAYGVVVCPTPWNDTGVEIQLAKPLPTASSHRAPSRTMRPWAIQTVAGADCVLSSVAGPRPIHGRHLNYFCGPSFKLGLWGFPDRKSQPWTIFIAPQNATVLTHRVAIRHAWI